MSDNDFLKVPGIENLYLRDYSKEVEFLIPSQTTQLKKANETLDAYLPKIETISQVAKEQSQSAFQQVEQLEYIIGNQEKQIVQLNEVADNLKIQVSDAKTGSIIANSIAILSLLIAFVSYFK